MCQSFATPSLGVLAIGETPIRFRKCDDLIVRESKRCGMERRA